MPVVDRRASSDSADGASGAARPASRRLRPWVFGTIVVLAAALRFAALEVRPMHADEAVHAAKFGRLLEHGRYEYDAEEYHGPTLNYLTLIPARLRGTERHADLDEATLRSVPAAAGVLLVAAHILLVPVVGFRAAALAALLAAVSPAMVYYSRYYIQETLLVAFSFGVIISACRYMQRPQARWAIAAGASAGLMYATKETSVIALGSMAAALVLARALGRRLSEVPAAYDRRQAATHMAAAGVTAVAVSVLFFSSFFSRPVGILDSLAAFTTYFARAGGASFHLHPWHYYFDILVGPGGSGGGPIWTEAAILALACVGLAGVVARDPRDGDRRPLSFVAAYPLLMAVVYASIPYKTPWCALGFLHGFVLLAGIGAARLLRASPTRLARPLVAALLVAATAHLAWLAWASSVRFASDPRNPYVYAHTGTGVFEILDRVETLARANEEGERTPIEVISSENLWPLPWYLRRFPSVRWETAPVDDGVVAPVILATPDMENLVLAKLYEWRPPGQRELYVPIFEDAVELRPQVEVRGYAAKSLWDAAAVR